MTDTQNTPLVPGTTRIIDLIYPVYPYDLEFTGPASIEHAEFGDFRWFNGSQTQAKFRLPRPMTLVLRLDYINMFPGQGMTVSFNDKDAFSHEDIEMSVPHQQHIKLEGTVENTLCVRYAVTNGASKTFPDDPRDLAMLFRTFAIHPADPELESLPPGRLDLTYAPHIGNPEANTRLIQDEYESGKTILKGLPPVVTLALTTDCNNRIPCVICDRNTRPADADCEINNEILERVVPLLKTASYVLLHCGGEAMLSRHFDKVISMISPPTRVSFATNAMLMTKKRADNMLAKDIMAGFVVSLDAATDTTYRVMRPGSKFETIINNAAYFIDRAKALGRDESKVTLNMTLCEANIHEAPMLVDLAESIGAWGVDFNHLNVGPTHVVETSEGWNWDYVAQSQFKDKDHHDDMLLETYYKAKDKGINFALVGTPFLGQNAEKYQEIVCDMTCQVAFQEGEEQSHWESSHHKKLSKLPACFKPWQETVIQPNGIVRACYFHEEHLWAVGNLADSEFMSIWNSDHMVRIREQFLKNAFARCCAESQPCMHRGRV